MVKIIPVTDKIGDRQTSVKLNDDGKCPICKSAIIPEHLSAVTHRVSGNNICSVFERCPNCNNTFINTYKYQGDSCIGLISSEPNRFEKRVFDDSVETLSPSFVEIYNQAFNAETMRLDQIAGIGYRKSVEFLIKAFVISRNPDDEEKIKSMPLAACINTYIDQAKIKTLATKTVWIGNDETHYVRKHTDRDIEDLKKFIQATVYYIGMELVAEDAESIPHA